MLALGCEFISLVHSEVIKRDVSRSKRPSNSLHVSHKCENNGSRTLGKTAQRIQIHVVGYVHNKKLNFLGLSTSEGNDYRNGAFEKYSNVCVKIDIA